MNNLEININNEIDELKSVVVHEPGFEFELIGPENKDYLLFDDIIYTEAAKQEHQQLCEVINKISNHESPCIVFTDLLSDIISETSIRNDMLNEMADYGGSSIDLLNDLDDENLIKAIIRGRDDEGNIFFENPIVIS